MSKETKHETIVIIGLGGVGSWLAEFIARKDLEKGEMCKEMILVDHDAVEEKNLKRQHYYCGDIGLSKVNACADKLYSMKWMKYKTINAKIEDKDDLLRFERDWTFIVATDDIETKTLVDQYAIGFKIFTNCDRDTAQIKYRMTDSDRKAWKVRSGYGSDQDIQSNIRAAQMALTALINRKVIEGREGFTTKVDTEDWTDNTEPRDVRVHLRTDQEEDEDIQTEEEQ